MLKPLIERLGVVELWIWPEGRYLETRWPTGERCPATRYCELNNLTYARHLGYPDCWTAVVCHEAAHSFFALRQGQRYSPTLYAVARGYEPGTAPYEERLYEEALVLSLERAANRGQLTSILLSDPVAPHLSRWLSEWNYYRAHLLGRLEEAAAA